MTNLNIYLVESGIIISLNLSFRAIRIVLSSMHFHGISSMLITNNFLNIGTYINQYIFKIHILNTIDQAKKMQLFLAYLNLLYFY